MTETNKHGKGGSSAFFWGLIIGALLATLLTTKKGRQILHDIIELGLELIEEFIADKKEKVIKQVEKIEEVVVEDKVDEQVSEEELAKEDLESEVAAEETTPAEPVQVKENEEVAEEKKTNGNGHQKKRLFRGIRRTK